jgi:hypothetical protein
MGWFGVSEKWWGNPQIGFFLKKNHWVFSLSSLGFGTHYSQTNPSMSD